MIRIAELSVDNLAHSGQYARALPDRYMESTTIFRTKKETTFLLVLIALVGLQMRQDLPWQQIFLARRMS